MSVWKWISIGMIAVGAVMFLLLGGTELQITGVVGGIVAIIGIISGIIKLIKDQIEKLKG